MYIISFILGLIIVSGSIFLIRRELNRAVLKQSQLIEQSKVYNQEDLFSMLESLQLSIDEMNRAFYDIANDLEGQISIHHKEIELLQQEINKIPISEKKPKVRDQIEVMQAKVSPVEDKAPTQSEVLIIDQIIEMRSRGLALTQIAKELGIGMGELQLLLTLKK